MASQSGSAKGSSARTVTSPNVWFFGDSITQGAGDANSNGYRKAVADLKLAKGYRFSMIGSRTHGTFTNNQHDGLPNSQILEAPARIVTLCGPGLTVEKARLIVYLHGTNDARQTTATSVIKTFYRTSLDLMFSLCKPDRMLIPVSIPPINPAIDAPSNARVVPINAVLAAAAAEFSAAHPGMVDTWDPYALLGGGSADFATDYFDEYHPNATTGYPKLAAGLITKIEPVLAWE